MNRFFRGDYISLNLIGAWISFTVAFCLCVGLWAFYKMEYLMSNINRLDLPPWEEGCAPLPEPAWNLSADSLRGLPQPLSAEQKEPGGIQSYSEAAGAYLSDRVPEARAASLRQKERKRMKTLLEYREKMKLFLGKYDIYIFPVLKFALALIVFLSINGNVGFMSRADESGDRPGAGADVLLPAAECHGGFRSAADSGPHVRASLEAFAITFVLFVLMLLLFSGQRRNMGICCSSRRWPSVLRFPM